jgi:outer membrane beta-barrel protein
MKRILLISIAILAAFPASAAEKKKPGEKTPTEASAPKPAASPAPGLEGPERVNVESIKEKYWARGDEAELGVVQNRLYSKDKKFQLGIFGGIVASDPFLSTKAVGGSLGFFFNEYVGVSLIGWKDFASGSSAREKLEEGGKKANTNEPSAFYGAEVTGSLLYGKLSFLGKKIIYYDLHVLGGLGATKTENGTYFTQMIGIGQQIYLNKVVALRVDYRLQRYNEDIVEREITAKIGQVIGSRDNWGNVISLGLTFLIGSGSSQGGPQ